ncbi:MAG: precorrin-6y C5,15-methyltransferase (decarboxylating) subunit CbiE [Candidatus Nitrospinota bacterium M3_3B_026]
MEKITIIGVGPGSPEYMTQAAREAAREADFLVGSAHALRLAHGDGERITVGADVQKAIEVLDEKRRLGRTALLVSGDPGLFSLARQVIERFGRSACRMIPGISSVQAAFALAGLGWEDAMIISAHAHDPEAAVERARECPKIAVLLGRDGALAWTARFAEALGDGRRAIIAENIGMENERVYETDPASLPGSGAASRAVLLLVREELMK